MALVKRELITVKIESTYNTDPTPAAADAVLCTNLSWSFTGTRMIERPAVRPSLGALKHLFGGTLMQVTFECEVKGAGAVYSDTVLPEIDALLRSCGMSTDVQDNSEAPGAETVTYEPESTGHESCTIWLYEDGLGHKITGCVGEVSFRIEAGNTVMASFTMTGHTGVHIDLTLIAPAYSGVLPPVANGQAFTIDSYAATISKLEFSLGNTISTPADLSASDGFGQIFISGRDVTGSFDPEAVVNVATGAYEANWRSTKEMALVSDYIGGTQYNKFKFNMPKVSYRSMAPGERDGLRTYEMGFGAQETDPYSATASDLNDEVTIVFD